MSTYKVSVWYGEGSVPYEKNQPMEFPGEDADRASRAVAAFTRDMTLIPGSGVVRITIEREAQS